MCRQCRRRGGCEGSCRSLPRRRWSRQGRDRLGGTREGAALEPAGELCSPGPLVKGRGPLKSVHWRWNGKGQPWRIKVRVGPSHSTAKMNGSKDSVLGGDPRGEALGQGPGQRPGDSNPRAIAAFDAPCRTVLPCHFNQEGSFMPIARNAAK